MKAYIEEVTVPACPTCGHMEVEALVAACDILIRRALELLGKRTLTGKDRRPCPDWGSVYLTHRVERPKLVRSLQDAWQLIPHVIAAHGCCGILAEDLELVLTQHVCDIVEARRPHSTEELSDRLVVFSYTLVV